jgi:hypothetical protein
MLTVIGDRLATVETKMAVIEPASAATLAASNLERKARLLLQNRDDERPDILQPPRTPEDVTDFTPLQVTNLPVGTAMTFVDHVALRGSGGSDP